MEGGEAWCGFFCLVRGGWGQKPVAWGRVVACSLSIYEKLEKWFSIAVVKCKPASFAKIKS